MNPTDEGDPAVPPPCPESPLAAAVGGSGCVICQNDDGKFVTTERYCQDKGGRIVEKLYGPCPVVGPNWIPTSLVADGTPTDGDLVVCDILGHEVLTTAENCAAWKGTVVRAADGPAAE